jgi:hypothetical protein
MDWNVRVVTKHNQIKDVKVYDYIYPSDAESAAIAQTDAIRVITSNPIFEDSNTDNNFVDLNQQNTSHYNSNNSYYWDNNDLYGYLLVTSIPSTIFWLMSPVACCIFNAVLCYWWFKK